MSTIADDCSVELIVQDGGSTDGTLDVLQGASHPNLHWCSEPDSGQSDALNKALARSSGDLVGWLNADELYLPGALWHVEDTFNRNPAIGLLHGDAVYIDASGRFLRLLTGYARTRQTLRWRGCVIPSCATFFRRENATEGWDTGLKLLMDWDIYLRMAAMGVEFGYVRYPLAAFRVHDRQVTSKPFSRASEEHALVRRRYGNAPHMPLAAAAVGDILHRINKVAEGARALERSASTLRGARLVDANGRIVESTWAALLSIYKGRDGSAS